jgi:hypothetical protein
MPGSESTGRNAANICEEATHVETILEHLQREHVQESGILLWTIWQSFPAFAIEVSDGINNDASNASHLTADVDVLFVEGHCLHVALNASHCESIVPPCVI